MNFPKKTAGIARDGTLRSLAAFWAPSRESKARVVDEFDEPSRQPVLPLSKQVMKITSVFAPAAGSEVLLLRNVRPKTARSVDTGWRFARGPRV